MWAKYDAFWQERDLQKSIGFSINVPLHLDRRRAALEQASAELARARSEQQRAEDQVRLSVVTAVERVREAHHLLSLSRERLLPAARDRVAAARAAYDTGQTSFLAVIDAERAVRDAELRTEEAIAQLSRRRAELDRAVGRLPVLSQEESNELPDALPTREPDRPRRHTSSIYCRGGLRTAEAGWPARQGRKPRSGETASAVTVATRPATPHTGKNELRFEVHDAAGTPVNDAEIDVRYDDHGGDGRHDRPARRRKRRRAALYRAEVDLEMSGTWRLAVQVKRPSAKRCTPRAR